MNRRDSDLPGLPRNYDAEQLRAEMHTDGIEGQVKILLRAGMSPGDVTTYRLLAKHTGSRSGAQQILHELAENGFVEPVPDDQEPYVTWRLREAGIDALRSVSRPEVERGPDEIPGGYDSVDGIKQRAAHFDNMIVERLVREAERRIVRTNTGYEIPPPEESADDSLNMIFHFGVLTGAALEREYPADITGQEGDR